MTVRYCHFLLFIFSLLSSFFISLQEFIDSLVSVDFILLILLDLFIDPRSQSKSLQLIFCLLALQSSHLFIFPLKPIDIFMIKCFWFINHSNDIGARSKSTGQSLFIFPFLLALELSTKVSTFEFYTLIMQFVEYGDVFPWALVVRLCIIFRNLG